MLVEIFSCITLIVGFDATARSFHSYVNRAKVAKEAETEAPNRKFQLTIWRMAEKEGLKKW